VQLLFNREDRQLATGSSVRVSFALKKKKMFRRRSKAKSDESVAYGTASAKVKARRAVLGPKGILKYVDADESLHTVYGSERNLDDSVGSFKSQSNKPQQNAHRRSHSVLFTAIEIREYARTVGDNPSCSSGPPIS
jgi:hypothetical protein